MDLTVQTREKFGKAVKALRREGLIPAELYGRGISNVHLAVPAKDFKKIFNEAGTSTVISLILGEEKKPAIIHSIDTNYLSGNVEHIDFYQVRMDEKIKAKIPVEFFGEAPGVKDKGGILNKSVAEIEVEALPKDLPHKFEADISVLDDFNKSIYVKDLRVPHGVEILIDPETAIASVVPPVKEEEKVETAPDVSEVKVETEEKKAERAAEKTEPQKGETKEK